MRAGGGPGFPSTRSHRAQKADCTRQEWREWGGDVFERQLCEMEKCLLAVSQQLFTALAHIRVQFCLANS